MTTPLLLQEALVKDLKALFASNRLQLDSNDELQNIHVYAQSIPYQDSEDDTDVFPYIEVRLEEGKDDGTTHIVSVVFVVGCYDSNRDNQGHIEVINILDQIHMRYGSNPVVGNNIAHQTGDWSWMMQEDSYYPYSFGAVTTKFAIASIRREDPYA